MKLANLLTFFLVAFSSVAFSADWGAAGNLNPSFANDNRFTQNLDLSGSQNTTPQDLPDWTQDLILYQLRIDKFGTLPTINSAREKLYTLEHLGITGVVLTPIAKSFKGSSWENSEYSGYYSHVEPDQIDSVLGTDADFTALVDELHAMGIKVFLDFEFHGVFDPDVFRTKMNWIDAYNDSYPDNRSSLLDTHPEFFSWTTSPNQTGVGPATINHPVYTDWNTAELMWKKDNGQDNTALMNWFKDVLVYDWVDKFNLDGLRLDLEPYEVANEVGYDYWEDVKTLSKTVTGRDIILIPEDGNAARNNAFAFAQEDFGVSNPRFGWAGDVKDFMVTETVSNYPENNPDHNLTVDPVNIVEVVTGINGHISRDETFYTSGISVHDNMAYTSAGHLVYFGYTMFQPFIPIWFMGNEFNVRDLTESYDSMHTRIYYNRLTWADYTANQDHLNAVRRMIYIRKKYKNLIGPSTHRLTDKPMVKVPVVGTQPDLPGYGYYNPAGDPVGIIVLGTKTAAVANARVKLPLVEMRLTGYAQYDFHNLMTDTITTLSPVNGDEFDLPDSLNAWDSLIYKIEPYDTFVFSDTYDSGGAAIGDLNYNLPARQSGSSMQIGYTDPYPAHMLTVAGELAMNDGGAVELNANLMPYLSSSCTIKIDGKVTTDWISVSMVDQGAGDKRERSPLSFLVRSSDHDDVLWVKYGVSGSTESMPIGQATMNAALGSFNPHDWHTYEFRVSATSPTTGTYDFHVDGVKIAGPLLYEFGDSTIRSLYWVNPPGGSGLWDNLKIGVAGSFPEYGDWSVVHGLSIGTNDARTDDPDLDGMDNLLEYALGGNPLADDTASILPTSSGLVESGGTNCLEYVYRRRVDATPRGLVYGISYKFDLTTNVWTSVGIMFETGFGPIDSEFESVTNEIPTVYSSEAFITLEVTEN